MVRAFTMGNLLVGGLMAAITVGMLFTVHLPGAVPIGILSGFLNLIPFLGLILASLLPVAAGLLEFSSVEPFVAILVTIIVLHIISSSFLIPKIIGSRVNIGSVAATLGVLFWGWLWGAMGFFLAIPLTAFVKLILDCYPRMIYLSNLMSETQRPVRTWRPIVTKKRWLLPRLWNRTPVHPGKTNEAHTAELPHGNFVHCSGLDCERH